MVVGDILVSHTVHVIKFSFQRHWLLFSHASEVRGKNTPQRKFASTGYQTHNHHVMSKQEGQDGPVSLHWLIREIHSYQTLHYLGIGLKHKTPYKD